MTAVEVATTDGERRPAVTDRLVTCPHTMATGYARSPQLWLFDAWAPVQIKYFFNFKFPPNFEIQNEGILFLQKLSNLAWSQFEA
jgi:hypothetical protein